MLQLMFVCSDVPTTAYHVRLAPSALFAFKDTHLMPKVSVCPACPIAEDVQVKQMQYV